VIKEIPLSSRFAGCVAFAEPCTNVILSGSEESRIFSRYEKQILRLSPKDDIPAQSLAKREGVFS
jgi:hypothetical protein